MAVYTHDSRRAEADCAYATHVQRGALPAVLAALLSSLVGRFRAQRAAEAFLARHGSQFSFRAALLALALAASLLAAGCTAPRTDEPAPASDALPAFGTTYVYDTGLAVEVAKPVQGTVTDIDVYGETIQERHKVYGPSEEDAKIGTPYTRFRVVIRNNTPATVDLAGGSIFAFAGPDGEKAGFDQYASEGGVLGNYLDGAVPAGASRVFTLAYDIPVQHRGDVFLDVAPGSEHPSVAFAGSTL